MLDYLTITAIILFIVSSILLIGSFTDRFSPRRCKQDISDAKAKYTVPITAKCIQVEERIVTRASGEYYSIDPNDYNNDHSGSWSKSIKVNQPTY